MTCLKRLFISVKGLLYIIYYLLLFISKHTTTYILSFIFMKWQRSIKNISIVRFRPSFPLILFNLAVFYEMTLLWCLYQCVYKIHIYVYTVRMCFLVCIENKILYRPVANLDIKTKLKVLSRSMSGSNIKYRCRIIYLRQIQFVSLHRADL